MKQINWVVNATFVSILAVVLFFAAGCCCTQKTGVCGTTVNSGKVCKVVNSSEKGLDTNADKNITLNGIRGE